MMQMSAARNMSGYLSGLSSPSVTESTATLWGFAQVELRRAYEVSDVFDEEDRGVFEREARQGVLHHLGVQVAALPVLICTARVPVA